MPRLTLIANPSASGFTGELHRRVTSILRAGYDVTAAWPDSADRARLAAVEAAERGVEVVAAMGGDGVAHHVANGLAGSRTSMALIPAGTTNVLARILGVPLKGAKAAARYAEEPKTTAIPLAAINADTVRGPQSAFGMFAIGAGFDADLVEAAERRPHGKVRFGGLHYAQTAFGLLRAGRGRTAANLRVESAGSRADAIAAMVQVHWPYTYFGPKGLRFTSEPTDDLAVLVIERLGFGNALSILGRALTNRRLDEAKDAEVWESVGKVVIEADPPTRLQADGELLGIVHALEVAPAAERLSVLV